MRIEGLINRSYRLQRKVLKQKGHFAERLGVIEASLSVVEDFLKTVHFDKDDKIAIVLRGLILRAFTSLQTSTILALCGYEAPTLSLLREVIEVEVLIRYFTGFGLSSDFPTIQSAFIESWLKSNDYQSRRAFGTSSLIDKMTKDDPKLQKSMKSDYHGHCESGVHPTPFSLLLQSRRSRTEELYPAKNPLVITVSSLEVAHHAARLARYVALLGIGLFEDSTRFRTQLNRLFKLEKTLRPSRHLVNFTLSTRLGDIQSMKKEMKWLVKYSERHHKV